MALVVGVIGGIINGIVIAYARLTPLIATLGIQLLFITHEGDSLVNTDVDIEAFDNEAFGARINEKLAECMGKSGKWTSFVGSLGSLTHNQWGDAGAENARQYPDMELVAEKNESFNDTDRAYEKAKEILRKYPDIKGFQGSSAIDVIGIGRAVEEAGLQEKTCVYGLGLAKDTGPYLESGAVDQIFFWDPKDAGYVMNKVSDLVLKGEEIKDGMDLGVSGYEKMTVIKGLGKGPSFRVRPGLMRTSPTTRVSRSDREIMRRGQFPGPSHHSDPGRAFWKFQDVWSQHVMVRIDDKGFWL